MTSNGPISAADAASIADVWVQAAIAIVTLGGIVASIWIARRGQKADLQTAKKEADRAERADAASQAASERAEAASRLNIDALTRIADALERVASAGIGNAQLDSSTSATAAQRVRWSLRHFNGDMYLLENIGDGTAYQVTLDADPTLMRFPNKWQPTPEVKPSEAVQFGAIRTMGTRDSTITVEWRDSPEGEPQVWRYPLPPRPPRR